MGFVFGNKMRWERDPLGTPSVLLGRSMTAHQGPRPSPRVSCVRTSGESLTLSGSQFSIYMTQESVQMMYWFISCSDHHCFYDKIVIASMANSMTEDKPLSEKPGKLTTRHRNLAFCKTFLLLERGPLHFSAARQPPLRAEAFIQASCDKAVKAGGGGGAGRKSGDRGGWRALRCWKDF